MLPTRRPKNPRNFKSKNGKTAKNIVKDQE